MCLLLQVDFQPMLVIGSLQDLQEACSEIGSKKGTSSHVVTAFKDPLRSPRENLEKHAILCYVMSYDHLKHHTLKKKKSQNPPSVAFLLNGDMVHPKNM